jgi:geranylgeranyl pyrophosphate synthase
MTGPPADLVPRLDLYRERVRAALDARLPPASREPTRLHEAMRYAVLGGGKRVRATLVYAAGETVEAPAPRLDPPACAVELVHAYSLVHDDLPAMDDDDLRRGRPTCHRAFDEATALLAGDALQTLAFECLATPSPGLPTDQRLAMVQTLAQASGSLGMAGGQAQDLAAVGHVLDLAGLERMHRLKTGALIRASVRLGALTGEDLATRALEDLDGYARCIGLAFQIQDDILDVEGETEAIGKTRGSDAARNKPTFPSLLGLEESKRRARDLHAEALEHLDGFGPSADTLRWISAFIVSRAS